MSVTFVGNTTQFGNLKSHMLIHTGERPHEFTICEKTVIQLDSLKTHTY